MLNRRVGTNRLGIWQWRGIPSVCRAIFHAQLWRVHIITNGIGGLILRGIYVLNVIYIIWVSGEWIAFTLWEAGVNRPARRVLVLEVEPWVAEISVKWCFHSCPFLQSCRLPVSTIFSLRMWVVVDMLIVGKPVCTCELVTTSLSISK